MSDQRRLWVIQKTTGDHISLRVSTQVYECPQKFVSDQTSLWVIQKSSSEHTSLWVSAEVYECPQKFMSDQTSLWVITQVYEWSKRLRVIHADFNQTVRDLQIELRRQRSSQTPPFRERQQSRRQHHPYPDYRQTSRPSSAPSPAKYSNLKSCRSG